MSSGRSAKGKDAIRGMLAEIMERSPRRVAHLETNPRVTLDGDRAER